MRPRTYKVEGIVIKRKNFGEADKLLTLFTKQHGKINCLAKGIRKLTSRKASSLELFNLAAVFLAKGKSLDIITETQLINSFREFRKVFDKVCLAYHFCELTDRLTAYNQAHRQIFDLLKESLESLVDDKVDTEGLKIQFKEKLLQNTGFGLPQIRNNKNLDRYIESIIEKKIKTNHLLESL